MLSSTLLFGGVFGLKFLSLIYAHSLVGFLVSRMQLSGLVWLFTVCELVTFCFTASSKLWVSERNSLYGIERGSTGIEVNF